MEFSSSSSQQIAYCNSGEQRVIRNKNFRQSIGEWNYFEVKVLVKQFDGHFEYRNLFLGNTFPENPMLSKERWNNCPQRLSKVN